MKPHCYGLSKGTQMQHTEVVRVKIKRQAYIKLS